VPTRDARVTTSPPIPVHHPRTDRVGKKSLPTLRITQSPPCTVGIPCPRVMHAPPPHPPFPRIIFAPTAWAQKRAHPTDYAIATLYGGHPVPTRDVRVTASLPIPVHHLRADRVGKKSLPTLRITRLPPCRVGTPCPRVTYALPPHLPFPRIIFAPTAWAKNRCPPYPVKCIII